MLTSCGADPDRLAPGGAPDGATAAIEVVSQVVEGERLEMTRAARRAERERRTERREQRQQESLQRAVEREARRTQPQGPTLAEPTAGRSGTGLALGAMSAVVAPVGGPAYDKVTTSVANIPNRTSAAGFASSLATLTAERQDFVLLNEVSARSLDTMRALAPKYAAYRDPVPDSSPGGQQSMNNVVMWRAKRWNLVDAGRVKVVDDDRGYLGGKPFLMDRYVTWTVLQHRRSAEVVSVVSGHMPTNPARFPRQPPGTRGTRVERYAAGMDRVLAVVRTLAAHGPVLLGGDMNSHASQGAWTAPQKMATLGYAHVKDQGVMYLFHQPGTRVLAHRQVAVASDHPAIITRLDLGGVGPTSY